MSVLRAPLCSLLCLAACAGPNYLIPTSKPVVAIETTKGRELGVTTDDGVIFLGRTAQEGPAKVLHWLEESPIVEAGEIRAMGHSLYVIELDVDLPTVPISFEPIRPGESLVLLGAGADPNERRSITAAKSSIASGTIANWPSSLKLRPESVGAGVFRETEYGLTLVGLLKGTAQIDGGERLLVLAGLPEFQAALLEPREAVPQREVVYRADGTRVIRSKSR